MLSFLEHFAISAFQSLLAGLHFDIEKHAKLKRILEPIRDTLNVLYPPDAPAAPAA